MENGPTKSIAGAAPLDRAEIRLEQAHTLFQAIIDCIQYVMLPDDRTNTSILTMNLARLAV